MPEPKAVPALLLDAGWVAAQRAAGAEDPSPHPLLEPDWIDPTRPWVAQGRTGVEWYLADPAHRTRSPHPLFALSTLDEQLPSAREHPFGPLAAWLEHVGSSPDAVLPGRPEAPQLTLGQLRELALSALRGTGAPGPDSAGVSVVLPVGPGAGRTVNWVRSVGEAAAAGADVELVAVAGELSGSHRVLAGTVAAVYGVRSPLRHDGPGAVQAAVVAAHGARLVLVRPGVMPDAEAALRLAAVLDDDAVAAAQPLLVDRADVVVSAGGVFTDDGLTAYLHGHAPRDAEILDQPELPTLVSPVVALDRVTWNAAGGTFGAPLDEADLGLRVRERGRVVLEPLVRMTWTSGGVPGSPGWARARARFAELRPSRQPSTLPVPPTWPRAQVGETAPQLRWTIDTAAAAGTAGETWGDLHFARSLAAALERRGQHVAVDPAAARERWSRDLDDVVLVLRGLDRVEPRPGPLHVLWVISHPEEVTAQEVGRYGLVRAASLTWSRDRSAAWGIPVAPLLQCTDPAVFHAGLAAPDTGPAVLFVGNSRGATRPALAGALAGGADVTVHGSGWASVLPTLDVASRQVPNTELGRLYASAGVVLNDHWADMRRDGFVSNRLFDAAACGARVLSDDVAGATELFGGLVRTFTDPAEVGGLLAEVPAGWPAYDERVRLAERVVREHSFDHRAETLLDAVAQRLRG